MHRLFQSILSHIEKVFWLNDPSIHQARCTKSTVKYLALWICKIPKWNNVSSLFIIQNPVTCNNTRTHSNHKNDKHQNMFQYQTSTMKPYHYCPDTLYSMSCWWGELALNRHNRIPATGWFPWYSSLFWRFILKVH